jgi:hypothetical protein
MPPEVTITRPPRDGVWRVAKGPDPLVLTDPPRPLLSPASDDPSIGNRFDSAFGDYRVYYFATELEGCYGETLAPLRPEPAAKAAADEDEGFWTIGEVPADWRTKRIAVRATFPENFPFVDVEDVETRAVLRDELAFVLGQLGLDDIDVAAIRSRDRRLTRFISQWVHDEQLYGEPPVKYAGVRFESRITSRWECWAVFGDVVVDEQERRSIFRNDPALQRVTDLYGLDVF